MKRFLNFAGRLLAAAVVMLVLFLLPVIPVVQVPVARFPTETPKLVSLGQLFGSFFVVGIRLQATILTVPFLIAACVVFVAVALRLRRFVFHRNRVPSA